MQLGGGDENVGECAGRSDPGTRLQHLLLELLPASLLLRRLTVKLFHVHSPTRAGLVRPRDL
jgi:hypothetical protein